jgi:hypothetical protein
VTRFCNGTGRTYRELFGSALRTVRIGIRGIPRQRRFTVTRTRRILAACTTAAAVFLATTAVAAAYMPMPPIKIPTPGHAYPVLTKHELLAAGGHCTFSGGFCTDRNGGMWDCSIPSNCTPVTDGRR